MQQIDKYLPLLQLTDLIRSIHKFRKSSLKIRQGNQKFYLVDMALRNAVLRVGPELFTDPTMLGLYAENLVYNALAKWPGVLQIDYYHENQKEVDFIVHIHPSQFLPVEVKYRNSWGARDVTGLRQFTEQFNCATPWIITKKREEMGVSDGILRIPLLEFLLLFDGQT